MKSLIKIALAAFVVILWSCSETPQEKKDGKPFIVTTTGMIKDAVDNIVGDKATVKSMMGPGVDPHLYKATQGDLSDLRAADIVFYNGIFLEGKMETILEKLGKDKPVIAVGESIDKSRLLTVAGEEESGKTYDPHIWFDVKMWADVVAYIGQKLQKADPDNAETYKTNTATYLEKLTELDNYVRSAIAQIPDSLNTLITSHDAFEYFGAAYDINVLGLQGVSTLAEFGLQDRNKMVDLILEKKVKAVFVESSVSDKDLKAVISDCQAQGHDVKIGGTLFSDAIGEEGTIEGTYIGRIDHNIKTIVDALK